MTDKPTMYYVGFCRICQTGPLGLRRCGRCGNVVLLCDECDAVWQNADVSETPIYPTNGELLCPNCDHSLIDPPSHWASEQQLESVEWLTCSSFVAASKGKSGYRNCICLMQSELSRSKSKESFFFSITSK